MPLDDHLLRNEQILASAKAASGGFLYATNQRVIKYDKGMFGEKVESLSYSHIVSAFYERKSNLGLLIAGIFFIILGFVLAMLPLEGGVVRTIAIATPFLFGGLFVFTCLFVGMRGLGFYQIKAVGLSEEERQLWRTEGTEAQAKTFARFIQDQISNRELPTSSPPSIAPPQSNVTKEIITREMVMVKCEYCQGLMPQTAPYCPNCGAKRRAS